MGHYLVTGAAGFIASRVATLLLEAGHTVVGVDNLNDAYDVRLKAWRLQRLKAFPNLTFHRLDIYDRHTLEAQVFKGQRFDAIFNLAARAGVRQSVADPWVFHDTNTVGTLNLLELSHRYDVPKFVLASTSSLYGGAPEMPYREDQCTDRPLSPYAASKKAAEALCHTYHYLYNIDVSILRYFTVYGPAGRPDMSLFRFVQWISEGRPVKVFGDGSQSRDFTYIDDIARGTIAALEPVGFDVFNLGSDTPILLMDAIRLIEEATQCEACLEYHPCHKADVPASWAGIGKAKQVLGWSPQHSFERGIADLVNWYQENRTWACQIRTD